MAKYHPKADEALTTLYPPCYYCKHLQTVGQQGAPFENWTCKAFPTGIPYVILAREQDHIHPWPLRAQTGDYVFESWVYDRCDGVLRVVDFWGEWRYLTKAETKVVKPQDKEPGSR